MPKGPKGQKRPADVIGNAVKVMKIATGEEPEDYGADGGKGKAAQSLERRGGKARAKALTRRSRFKFKLRHYPTVRHKPVSPISQSDSQRDAATASAPVCDMP